jgi:hypothetical protein
MAAIYGVHRGTVARWLVETRRMLLAQTKELLAATHPLESGDLRSLYRLLEEEVQVTLSILLTSERPEHNGASRP